MVNAGMTPIAEYVVKLKIDASTAETKAQITKSVEDNGKIFRNQLSMIRKDARAFGMIGKDLNKLGNYFMKAITFGGIGLIALSKKAIAEYLKTTDVGAIGLRKSIAGLTYSWDQFLARFGRTITQSGILTSVIESLKKFLDGLSDEKILRILDQAKWMAILGIALKIAGTIALWVRDIGYARSGWLWLTQGRANMVGTAAAAAAAGAAGSGINTSLSAGAGAGAGTALTKYKSLLPQVYSPASVAGGGNAVSEALALQVSKIAGAFSVVFAVLSKAIKAIFKFGVIFEVIIGVFSGIFRALGVNLKDSFDTIIFLIEGIVAAFNTFGEAIAYITEWIINLFSGKKTSDQLSKEFWDRIDKIWKPVTEKIQWKGGADSINEDPLKFMNKGVSTSTFAGLNQAAQQMAWSEENKDLAYQQLEELKQIKQNTTPKNQEVQARQPGTWSWKSAFLGNTDKNGMPPMPVML